MNFSSDQIKSSQSIDYSGDQVCNRLITGVPDMPAAVLTADVGDQMVEFTADGPYLIMSPVFWKDGRLEPVVDIAGQHLQQQEKFVALLVPPAVLVRSLTILEFIDLVLDITVLIVLMEDLFHCQIIDVSHNKRSW